MLASDLNDSFMALVSRAYNDPCAFLGQGAFGTVLRVIVPTAEDDAMLHALLVSAGLDHLAGTTIAVKTQIRGSTCGGEVFEEGMKNRELQGSPHVLQCYGGISGVLEVKDGNVMLDCLLLEFAEQGSVLSWSDKQVERPAYEMPIQMMRMMFAFSFLQHAPSGILAFMSSVVGFLAFLKEKEIAHSDLKLENFLVDGKGRVKGGDLATCGPMGSVPTGGSFFYIPPEGGRVKVWGERDMWAGGCCGAQLTLGKPHELQNISGTMGEFGEEGLWEYVLDKDADGSEGLLADQPELEDLLRRMLACDSSSRITPAETMAHAYFVKHSGGDLEGFWGKVFAGEGPCLPVL